MTLYTRNYAHTSVKAINRRIKDKGYFSLREVKNEYSPKFLAGLMQACSEMVANGKLVYDERIRAYKNPAQLNAGRA